jgi:hypothetical protein
MCQALFWALRVNKSHVHTTLKSRHWGGVGWGGAGMLIKQADCLVVVIRTMKEKKSRVKGMAR